MSLNKYNSSTGVLENIASGQRVVIYTKAAYEAAKQAGTLPADTLVMITDDVKEGGEVPELDAANRVELSTTAITTTTKGAILGSYYVSGSTACGVMIDGYKMYHLAAQTIHQITIQFIAAGSTISLTVNPTGDYKVYFVPYKTAE